MIASISRIVLLGIMPKLLGAVLLLAGVLKLADISGFVDQLAMYDLLPPGRFPQFAVFVCFAEIATGAGLWIGRWVRPALLAASLLSWGFVGVLGSAQLRGIDLECGCFGSLQFLSSDIPTALTRAIGIAVVATSGYSLALRVRWDGRFRGGLVREASET